MFVGVGGGRELVEPTVTKKIKRELVIMRPHSKFSTSGCGMNRCNTRLVSKTKLLIVSLVDWACMILGVSYASSVEF